MDVVVQSPQPKPKASLDLARGFVYQSTIGFRVAIDGLHNVKGKAGSLFKVLYSVFPPGSFYQTPRVGKDVHFTVSTDWTSAQASPEFTDGFVVRAMSLSPLVQSVPQPLCCLISTDNARSHQRVQHCCVDHRCAEHCTQR
jgi:hypothetical protein